ncbi:MAG TPA: DMT family transporter [Gemmatimonadales bacterium]|jgi:drug/metabolite transporter (DMT)-like permease|nr:DMT family transporter [Gemmatimonadales bacterium]
MHAAPSRRAAVFWMLLVVAIWGLNITVSKWTLREFPPLAFTALRFVMASALLAWILHRREGSLALPPGALPWVVGLGLIGNTIYQMGFILGLASTTATNSSLVLASMPAIVAGLGAALGVERLTLRGAEGLLLATVGVVLVIAAHGFSFTGGTMTGDLLTFGAVICWSLFTLGIRRHTLPMSALAITTWTIIAGTIPLVLLGLPELAAMSWSATTPAGWAGLVYSAIFSLVIGYIIWNRSVRVVGSNRTAIFNCLTPVVAMLTAVIMLGERPGGEQIAGGVLVILGVLLSQRAAHRPSAADSTPSGEGGACPSEEASAA